MVLLRTILLRFIERFFGGLKIENSLLAPLFLIV